MTYSFDGWTDEEIRRYKRRSRVVRGGAAILVVFAFLGSIGMRVAAAWIEGPPAHYLPPLRGDWPLLWPLPPAEYVVATGTAVLVLTWAVWVAVYWDEMKAEVRERDAERAANTNDT
jgi:hypothetical protein